MPRYFFNVHDGANSPDRECTELPDDDAARQQVITFAGKMLSDEASSLAPGDELHIEVTDTTGIGLFQLDFRLTASSAVRSTSLPPNIGEA